MVLYLYELLGACAFQKDSLQVIKYFYDRYGAQYIFK